MPVGPARMPLFDHLGELRMRLVRIVACLAVAVCVFYMATPTVAQFLLQPVWEFMPHDDQGLALLNVFGAFDAFSVRFKISLWTSIVACAPVILWQILAFFLPALKPSERKWFVPTFAAATSLFIFGTVFCYLIILNPAFQWLTDQAQGFAQVMPEAKLWIDIIIKFELGFGFAFELPLIIFYLVMFDVVSYSKLRKSWRMVYLVLLIISAMVTPDASPVTMALMFAAMVVLYEGSLLIARLALGKRVKKQKEELEREAAEEEEWQAEREAKKLKKLAENDEA
ncbi:MAG: twin-arginine translocase subunit TatC [Raoultibacter sp.]